MTQFMLWICSCFSNYTQNGIFMVKTTNLTWIVLVPPKNFKNVTNCTTNPQRFDREKILIEHINLASLKNKIYWNKNKNQPCIMKKKNNQKFAPQPQLLLDVVVDVQKNVNKQTNKKLSVW